MVKYITLCADDYGQNPEISQAIVDLIYKKVLTASSCMTSSVHWLEQAKSLIILKDQVDLGLHFNLTEGSPLVMSTQFYSLEKLMIHSFLHRLDKIAIEAELNAQIDQFIAGIGQLPDFIDGHQHVHQLPVIRDILIKVYNARFRSSGIYIRSLLDFQFFSYVNATAYFKKCIIQASGCYAFKKLLMAHHIPHNTSFAGIYHFKNSIQYSQFFTQFLQQITDGGLIMCHPGKMGKNDSIAKARYDEYQFFSSDLFLKLNKQSEVIMTRFNHKK